MSKLTAEIQALVGTSFIFQRDPINGVASGAYDLGLFEPAPMKATTKVVTIYDNSGGRRRPIKTLDASGEWTVDLKTSNLNMRNLQLLFHSAVAATFTQAATALTVVPHMAYPDSLLKLIDASGNPMYNIASIQQINLNVGDTALTAGTDYIATADDLLRGFVRILAGGAISAPTAVNINYTPAAITGSRLLVPNTGPCQIEGAGYFFAVSASPGDDGTMAVFDGRFALSVSSANFAIDKESDIDVKLMKLYDPTNVNPSGRYLQFTGTLATGS